MEFPMYAWNLAPPSPGAQEVELLPNIEEGLIDGHPLEPVKREDSQPNGKFRFIVKLRVQYRDTTTGTSILKQVAGTGWLVAKNLVVTSGHVVIPKNKYNKAVSIRAFIGYEDKSSFKKPPAGMEERKGCLVATPCEYHFNRNRKHDVAFIHLESEFEDVNPIQYGTTPDTTKQELLVVGYPADPQRAKDAKDTGDVRQYTFNGQMCCSEGKYLCAVSSKPDTGLIKHTASTYNGSSGAPLLLIEHGQFIGIGTHRGEGLEPGLRGPHNVAIPIGQQVDVKINYEEYIGLLRAIASNKAKIESDQTCFRSQAGTFLSQERRQPAKDRGASTRTRNKPEWEAHEEDGDEEGMKE